MSTRSDPIRGTIRPTSDRFTCRRCGTDNHRGVAPDCPWCMDCMGAIALDPAYLRNHPDAQALLDRWINRRNGAHRRVLATTGATP